MCQQFKLPKQAPKRRLNLNNDNNGVDQDLICPLSNEIMKEPVISIFDGKTYDKQEIIKFWKKYKCKIPNYDQFNQNANIVNNISNSSDFENVFGDDDEIYLAETMLEINYQLLNRINDKVEVKIEIKIENNDPQPPKKRQRLENKNVQPRV